MVASTRDVEAAIPANPMAPGAASETPTSERPTQARASSGSVFSRKAGSRKHKKITWAATMQQKDLEWIHRYNILFLRARLLVLLGSEKDLLDEPTAERVGRYLDRYCTVFHQSDANVDPVVSKAHPQVLAIAIRNYRHFREEGHLFPHDEAFTQMVTDMTALFEMESQGVPPDDLDYIEIVGALRRRTNEGLASVIDKTTSGIKAKTKQKASKALMSRLLMGLGGGLAVVGPMLLMVLHPTKLTAVLTTSCCVIAVAVGLAVFMTDSQPKDVVACTAAYAAVLVVFASSGNLTA